MIAAAVLTYLGIYSVVQQVAFITLDYGGIKETLVVSRRGNESFLATSMDTFDDAHSLCLRKIMHEGEYFPGMSGPCLQRFTYYLQNDGIPYFRLPFSSSMSRP